MYSYIASCAEVRKKSGDVKKTTQTFVRTLSFFQVLICVTVKSKAEGGFTGTEGGSVEIFCKYPDGYQYKPMYFCRHPCSFSDILIKSKKVDMPIFEGRYTALNTVSTRSFSVNIRHLSLKDSGVYYCGVNKWGFDILIKVKLTVTKVSRQNQRSEVTEVPSAPTATADCLTSYEQTSTTTQSPHSVDPHGQLLAPGGGVLGLLLCCVLVTLVILYRKTSTNISSLKSSEIQFSHPPPDQEDICHVYDEILAVYSLGGPATGDESSATYSTVQVSAPADNDCSPYSLIAPH